MTYPARSRGPFWPPCGCIFCRQAHGDSQLNALYLVLGGERLPMTGPEALTMAEIADHISCAAGKSVRYAPISPEQRRRSHGCRALSTFGSDTAGDKLTP